LIEEGKKERRGGRLTVVLEIFCGLGFAKK